MRDKVHPRSLAGKRAMCRDKEAIHGTHPCLGGSAGNVACECEVGGRRYSALHRSITVCIDVNALPEILRVVILGRNESARTSSI